MRYLTITPHRNPSTLRTTLFSKGGFEVPSFIHGGAGKISLSLTLVTVLVYCTSCYQRQDPLVRAAYDLQRMADQFASQEDTKLQQFDSLRLGMSADDVMRRLGAPASQQAVSTDKDESRELWVYRGTLRPLGTLTFVNKRLTEIKKE